MCYSISKLPSSNWFRTLASQAGNASSNLVGSIEVDVLFPLLEQIRN